MFGKKKLCVLLIMFLLINIGIMNYVFATNNVELSSEMFEDVPDNFSFNPLFNPQIFLMINDIVFVINIAFFIINRKIVKHYKVSLIVILLITEVFGFMYKSVVLNFAASGIGDDDIEAINRRHTSITFIPCVIQIMILIYNIAERVINSNVEKDSENS